MIDGSIDEVTFTPSGEQATMTWRASLEKNYTDGILILHHGEVVYEKYSGELREDRVHACMSVTKSFVGTLGTALVAEGVLDPDALVTAYVPELAESAFGDAAVRQVLDMTTALKFSEDYSDPKAEVYAYSAAGNPLPKPEEYTGPRNYYEYLVTVEKQGEHGDAFGYKTINTEVLGWIIARATGKSVAELLSEKIWRPMGAGQSGYFQVDGIGTPFCGGGFSCGLRDLARFGEMIRNDGFFNGRQILPKAVVDDIRRGGDRKAFARSTYSKLKGWSYRNMWWVTHNEHGAFTARGVHGQTIYIDPTAGMVIARFASHPVAFNSAIDPYSLPAYHAVAKYLMETKR
jgi:hypothetical protein